MEQERDFIKKNAGIPAKNIVEDSEDGGSRGTLSEDHERKTKITLSSMDVEDVPINPPKRFHFIYEQVHRLATMPRHKQSDFAHHALFAAIATATSGIAGWMDITSPKPTQDIKLDVAEIVIFVVCVVLAIVGYFITRSEETAEEYLNRICGLPKKSPTEFQKWRRRTFSWFLPPHDIDIG